MNNTLFLDDELLFRRASRTAPVDDDSLVEIEFADMEAVDSCDLVGVYPLEATASIPFPLLELVGVPPAVALTVASTPYAVQNGSFDRGSLERRRLGADELPTEEYDHAFA
jgi:hypothetical protein